jgi:hypothetical protein
MGSANNRRAETFCKRTNLQADLWKTPRFLGRFYFAKMINTSFTKRGGFNRKLPDNLSDTIVFCQIRELKFSLLKP